MSEKFYSTGEAAVILLKKTEDLIKKYEAEIQDLRKRELAKQLIPPHKHNTGSPVSAAVEDVPPSQMNAPGKDDKLVGGTATRKIESSPETLCKKCGKGHGLEKACDGMDKAEMAEASEESSVEESTVELSSEHVNKPTKSDPGSGGIISKGKKLGKAEPQPAKSKWQQDKSNAGWPCDDCGTRVGPVYQHSEDGGRLCHGCLQNLPPAQKSELAKAATPPMAKPPSGTNMATKVPTSAPKAPVAKDEMPDVSKVVVPKSQKPKVPSDKRDYTAQVSKEKTVYKPKPAKEELEKGVMADIAQRESVHAGAPKPKDPGANVKLPSQTAQAARAADFSAAMAGEYQPKPAAKAPAMATLAKPAKPVSTLASPKAAGIAPKSAGPVMNAARPTRPGIFGKLFGKK